MAISLSDNIQYSGTKPDFERQQYATKAAMKAVRDVQMPPLYFGWCLEDSKLYLYNKTNPVDETLGRWRIFTSENPIQVEALPEPSALWSGFCLQYLGETTEDVIHGYFYECVSVDDEYIWQNVVTSSGSEPSVIPSSDIEALFD